MLGAIRDHLSRTGASLLFTRRINPKTYSVGGTSFVCVKVACCTKERSQNCTGILRCRTMASLAPDWHTPDDARVWFGENQRAAMCAP
jgi:hypothetical protein